MEEFFIDDIEFSDEEINFSLAAIKPSRTETHLSRQKTMAVKEDTTSTIKSDSKTPKVKKFNFVKTPNILRNKNNNINHDIPQLCKENPSTLGSNNSGKTKNKRDCSMTKETARGKCTVDISQTFIGDDDVDDDILSHIELDLENKNTTTPVLKRRKSNEKIIGHELTKNITNCKLQNDPKSGQKQNCFQPNPCNLRSSNYEPKKLNCTPGILKENGSYVTPNKQAKPEQSKSIQSDKFQTPKSIPISHVTPKRKLNSSIQKDCRQGTKSSNGQRKFPGPAGNLPKLKNVTVLSSKSPELTREKRPLTPCTPKTSLQNMLNLSQDSYSYNNNLWKEMKQYINNNFMATTDNISTVLHKASNKQLNNCKVELLYGIVRSFSVSGTASKMVLKDHSGEITCAVHRDVLEEHQTILKSGTGMILKDVSVYSPTLKKHYINITPSNIDRFFLSEPSNESFTQTQTVTDSSPQRQTKKAQRENERICDGNFDSELDKFFCDDL